MPEAFAVLLVGVVCLAAYIGARVQASGAPASSRATADQLLRQRAWLEERLAKAGREQWDPAMQSQLAADLREVEAALRRCRQSS